MTISTKITNCDICNYYRLLRRYYGVWMCDNCISRVSTIVSQCKQKHDRETYLNMLRSDIKEYYKNVQTENT